MYADLPGLKTRRLFRMSYKKSWANLWQNRHMRDFIVILKWRTIEGYRMLTRQGKRAIIATFLAVIIVIAIGVPITFYLRGFLVPNFSRVAGLSDQLKELTGIDLKLIVISFFFRDNILYTSG